MKINHNIPALRTLTAMNKANDAASNVMLRLSSGLRINSAADDAAGMAISQKMDTQVRGLKQANRNAMDGISMIQTAEGACNEVHAMLQRMRELTVQAANGTYDTGDKETIEDEINSLMEEIVAIQDRTEFNKKGLLNGSQDNIVLQVGANENQSMPISGDEMNLSNVLSNLYGVSADMTVNPKTLPAGSTVLVDGKEVTLPTGTLPEGSIVTIKLAYNPAGTPPGSSGIGILDKDGNPKTASLKEGEKLVLKVGKDPVNVDATGTSLTLGADTVLVLPGEEGKKYNQNLLKFDTKTNTDDALVRLDAAIDENSKIRSKLGAYQNRLEHTVSNLGVSEENMTAALSRIQDADMAEEMSEYTRFNILSQASTAMLAQANQRPQQILQLLQG